MSDVFHPARGIPFDTLIDGLRAACDAGMVHRRFHAETGLSLFIYSPKCTYERGWNEFSVLARGLIIDESAKEVIATPFPKFFNLGENGTEIPSLPFEAFEKLDGSLIIAFHRDGKWRATTKGAFESEQAKWAQERLDRKDISALVPGSTYLFEAVYPENRIVVHYEDAALVLLGAYDPEGKEHDFHSLALLAEALKERVARRFEFQSIEEMVTIACGLRVDEEGFVVRFSDGLRIKIKGAEYRRIHALISRCSPLAIWEILNAGGDPETFRKDLPEELLVDFDGILSILVAKIKAIETEAMLAVSTTVHLSNKEIGLSSSLIPDGMKPYVFSWRKTGAFDDRCRSAMMRSIRPAGNVLPGYTPSFAMARVAEEIAS